MTTKEIAGHVVLCGDGSSAARIVWGWGDTPEDAVSRNGSPNADLHGEEEMRRLCPPVPATPELMALLRSADCRESVEVSGAWVEDGEIWPLSSSIADVPDDD